MPDIVITKRHNQAFVVGVTDAGKHWIKHNIEGRLQTIDISIPADVADEMANNIRVLGLDVEVK